MAANSLVYFVYSLLTLAANDKQATESSLKSWESPVAQQWDQEAYPIDEKYEAKEFPWRVSPLDKVDSDEAERYLPTRIVDPDEAEQYPPPTSGDPGGCPSYLKCSENCRRQGWRYGECTGPDGLHCNCYGRDNRHGEHPTWESPVAQQWEHEAYPIDEKYDAEEFPRTVSPLDEVDSDEAERYVPTHLVDPYEAEQYPPPTSEDPVGCPDKMMCSKSCRKRGSRYGVCTGPDGRECKCYGKVGRHGELPSILHSGGCPSNDKCTKRCNEQGKKIGTCQGFQHMECHCY